MKYFLHDTSAFQDDKVTLLYMKFGFEGVGLFYCILEKIARQEKPVAEQVLKTQLYIKGRLQKQLNFMYEIGILSIKNGDVFNENLLSFSQKYQIKKEKTRKRVEQWRAKTQDVTRYERVSNARKVNISKVNKSKEKNIKKRNIPEKIKNDFSADVIDLAKLFSSTLEERLKPSTPREKYNWLKALDGCIRLDHFSKDQIEQIIKRFRYDDFWRDKFLSPVKLRNKNRDGVKYINYFWTKINGGAINGQQYRKSLTETAAKLRSSVEELFNQGTGTVHPGDF